MRLVILLLMSLTTMGAHAAAPNLDKKHFHENREFETSVGYSKAVRVGDMLYISGHVGVGAMPDAIRATYDDLKKTLAAHGLNLRHVVKENLYTTNLDELIRNREIRNAYYQKDGTDYPAATWVEVKRLYVPEIVLEVELVAVFPKK